jgi:transcriptional regulator with XRE-family HTH domain
MLESGSMSDASGSTAGSVGRHIAEALRRRGMPNAELARRMSIDPSTVTLYVNGGINISVRALVEIARHVEYDPCQIIRGNFDVDPCGAQ